MRYINTNKLLGSINPLNLPLLLVLENASKEDISMQLSKVIFCDEELNILIEKGYVKEIKGKKSDTFLQKLRLDSKGRSWLDSLEEPMELDTQMFDYLCDMYLSVEDEDRKIGNRKKTLLYCTQFRLFLGLSKHQMFYLCEYFLEEFLYTKVLEYIFFNSNKNRYGTFNRETLHDSPLYQFYQDKNEEIKKVWAQKIKI